MTRKSSQHINLGRMRKSFTIKPLTLGVMSVFLAACSDNKQQAMVYKNADECADDNPQHAQECQSAYQQALQEAQRTAPKYSRQADCESEFGPNQCLNVQQSNGSFFMPFMAGFMISNLLSPSRYQYQPLFTSYSPYSPYRYRWLTADGLDYGDLRKRRLRVNQDAFKPKPAATRTLSRGGFGSSVRAKANWGSKRSTRGSWGG